jgi:hypothetical protein
MTTRHHPFVTYLRKRATRSLSRKDFRPPPGSRITTAKWSSWISKCRKSMACRSFPLLRDLPRPSHYRLHRIGLRRGTNARCPAGGANGYVSKNPPVDRRIQYRTCLATCQNDVDALTHSNQLCWVPARRLRASAPCLSQHFSQRFRRNTFRPARARRLSF